MRKKGKIVFWNEEKGFGFILPDSGKSQLFVHISDFESGARRPQLNDAVRYITSSDKQGRACGKSVLITGEKRIKKNRLTISFFTYIIILPFVLFAAWSFYTGSMPIVLVLLYALLSVITFSVYAIDKSAAKKDKWRIPENTLHMLSIACGWPGAMLAQKILHHKNQKQNFRFVFRVTIVLNVSLFFLLYTSYDSASVQEIIRDIEKFISGLLP